MTILITDDHTLIRETWSFIINSDPRFIVIGECSSGEEAVEKAKHLRPDVILMDINLSGMNGIEATEQILKIAPQIKILAVSMHAQPVYARNMMQKGAMGYITKSCHKEEMFTALLMVQQGRSYVCHEIKNNLSLELLLRNERSKASILTKRELEIIALVKKGDSSKEIAETLSLSFRTVEVHRFNILKKLNLKNTAALVNYMNSQQQFLVG